MPDSTHALRTAIKLRRRQVEIAERLIAKVDNGKDANSLHQQGLAAYQLGSMDLSVELLERSYAVEPSAQVAGVLAMAKLRSGQPADALKWISSAIESDATGSFEALGLDISVPYSSIYALVNFNLGNLDIAIDSADAALGRAQDDPTALEVKGRALLLKGNVDEAIVALTTAVRVAPEPARPIIEDALSAAQELVRADLSRLPFSKGIDMVMWPA